MATSLPFECPICCIPYDEKNHIPKIIPCGHTICSECIRQLSKTKQICPFDRTKIVKDPYQDFPTNRFLFQISTDTFSSNLCLIHNQPKDLVCLVDKVTICKECTQSKEHKGHAILQLEESKNTADKEKKKSSKRKEFGERDPEEKCEIGVRKIELQQRIKAAFTQARKISAMKEEAAMAIVENYTKEVVFKRIEDDFLDDPADMTLENSLKTEGGNRTEEYIKNIENLNSKMELDLFLYSQKMDNMTKDFKRAKDEYEIKRKNEKIKKSLDIVGSVIYGLFKRSEDHLSLSPAISKSHNQKDEIDSWRGAKKFTLDFSWTAPTKEFIQALHRIPFLIGNDMTEMRILMHAQNENFLAFCSSKFWKSKKIQIFELDMSNFKGTFNHTAQKMIENVQHFKDLEELTMNFTNTNVGDDFVQAFAKALATLGNPLRSLKLLFSTTKLTDKGFEGLFQCFSLRNTFRLQTLSLSFTGCKFKETSVTFFLKEKLPHFDRLTNLSLMCDTSMNDSHMELLCAGMKSYCHKIRVFHLNLTDTQVTDNGLVHLPDLLLSKMTSLQDLSLNLTNTKVSDVAVQMIFTSLEPVYENLTSLYLNILFTAVGNESILLFCYKMLPKFKKLQTLEFFLAMSFVDNFGICCLCEAIMSTPELMKTLQNFELKGHPKNETEEIKEKISFIKKAIKNV